MARQQITGESMIQEQQALLDVLYEIRLNGPTKTNEGICTAVANALGFDVITVGDIDDLLADVMGTWPKSTGSVNFPVPGTNGLSNTAMYVDCSRHKESMWDKSTEYGQLRWELLDHCIAQLQIQLSKV